MGTHGKMTIFKHSKIVFDIRKTANYHDSFQRRSVTSLQRALSRKK